MSSERLKPWKQLSWRRSVARYFFRLQPPSCRLAASRRGATSPQLVPVLRPSAPPGHAGAVCLQFACPAPVNALPLALPCPPATALVAIAPPRFWRPPSPSSLSILLFVGRHICPHCIAPDRVDRPAQLSSVRKSKVSKFSRGPCRRVSWEISHGRPVGAMRPLVFWQERKTGTQSGRKRNAAAPRFGRSARSQRLPRASCGQYQRRRVHTDEGARAPVTRLS